jgi:hypothetical protein
MRFVLNRGFGWHAVGNRGLRWWLSRLLSDPSELDKTLENLRKIPRKNGAEEIAERVISEVESAVVVADGPTV